MELVCTYVSGDSASAPIQPTRLFQFLRHDLQVRNTLSPFEDLKPLLDCSLGKLVQFAEDQTADGTLNTVSMSIFIDEEKARFEKRKRDRENWTCFFCFELNRVDENPTCKKCGQTKAESDKGRRLEDQHKKAKEEEREAKRKKERAAARARGEEVSDSEEEDPDAGLTLRQRREKEKRLEKEAEENKAREAKEAKEAAEKEMADKIAGRGGSREGKADTPDGEGAKSSETKK